MAGTSFTVNFGNYNLSRYNPTNYTRANAYNTMTPYMANLYAQRGGFIPMGGMWPQQQSQTFEVKTSFAENLGTMIGTLEKNKPGTLKNIWNWCTDKAFPAIGKAATWAWNGIKGLFSKKTQNTESTT